MNARRAGVSALAVLLLVACGGDGDGGSGEAESTQAAPISPATQAPPPPPATPATAPDSAVAAAQPAPNPEGYANCVARARGKSADEREVLMRICANLPGAPKQ